MEVGITGNNFGRGHPRSIPESLVAIGPLVSEEKIFSEFPIGSYVKLSSTVGRRDELLNTFLEENHPMTISSTFCSY